MRSREYSSAEIAGIQLFCVVCKALVASALCTNTQPIIPRPCVEKWRHHGAERRPLHAEL